jgi:hypothetical protein
MLCSECSECSECSQRSYIVGRSCNSLNPANSANMRTVNKTRIKIASAIVATTRTSAIVATTRTARTHCGVYCGFFFTVRIPQYISQHFSSEKSRYFSIEETRPVATQQLWKQCNSEMFPQPLIRERQTSSLEFMLE